MAEKVLKSLGTEAEGIRGLLHILQGKAVKGFVTQAIVDHGKDEQGDCVIQLSGKEVSGITKNKELTLQPALKL